MAVIWVTESSRASGCTITWVGDIDGNWLSGTSGDNTNWSDNTFPDAADHACLNNLALPYTVSLGTSTTVDHFSIESNATLTIASAGGATLIAEADSSNAGTVNLGQNANLRAVDGTAGTVETITNTGTINFPSAGGSGQRRLDGNVANQGTISVSHPEAGFVQSGAEDRKPTLTNSGTMTVATGGVFTVSTAILAQASGGTINGPGPVNIAGGDLRVNGGTIAASADINTADFSGATLGFGTAPNTATGNIDVQAGTIPLTGDIPAGISLDIGSAGGTVLRSATSFTNAGTVNLGQNGNLQALDGTAGTVETITNTGTINAPSGGPGGSRRLDGDVANQGTISISHPDAGFAQSGFENRKPTLTNTGTLTVATGGVFTVTTAILQQASGGTINGPGPVNFAGAGDLRVNGGTIAANAVVRTLDFSGATLGFAAAPNNATGNIDVLAGTTPLTGNIPAGISLDVGSAGGTILRSATSFTNAGTVNLGQNGNLQALNGDPFTTETITNAPGGTINFPLGGSGFRGLDGDVANQGTISVSDAQAGFAQSGAENRKPTLTNTGTITAAGGGVFTVTTGILEQASGATISGPGAVNIAGGASILRVTGGQIINSADINLLDFSGAALAFGAAPNNATGSIDVRNGIAPLTGNIPAGISIDTESPGGGGLRSATSFSNAGTVNLGPNGKLQALDGNGATVETITNTGTINMLSSGGGGFRELEGNVTNQGAVTVGHPSGYFGRDGFEDREPSFTNAAAGTLTINSGGRLAAQGAPLASAGNVTVAGNLASPTVNVTGGLLAGTGTIEGALTNGGEVAPGPGIGTLKVTGAYTQNASGKLSVRVDAPNRDQLDSDGAANLNGTLAISTGAAPSENDTFKVLDSTSLTGTFSNVTGESSGPYTEQYAANGVTLVTGDPGTLPTLSIDDTQEDEGNSGTNTATFTARLSAAQSDPVTVNVATENGTATAPGDFQADTGTVTFAPGDVARPIDVDINGDTTAEPNETFKVVLSDPEGARFADDEATGTIFNDELEFTSVSPERGGDGGTVQITAHGRGFVPGTTLRLTRSGQSPIVATSLENGASGRFLSGVVDLRGKAQGAWNVTATLPAGRGTPQTLTNAFTIEANKAADVWIKFTGRDAARVGTPYEGWIAYGNTGNVDATGVTIELSGLSAFDALRLPFRAPDGVVSRTGNTRTVTFYLDRVGPGTTRYIPFEPRFGGPDNVNLRARIVPNTFDPGDVESIDPDRRVTSTVTSTSPGRIQGVHTVSGTPGGAITYDYQSSTASGPGPRTIERTVPSAGVLRFRLRGTFERSPGQFRSFDYTLTGPSGAFEGLKGTGAPPTGRSAARAKRRVGAEDLYDALKASGESYKLVTQAELLDCLRSKNLISQETATKALHEAEGKVIIGILKLVPTPGGPAGDITWDLLTDVGGQVLDTQSKDTITDELRQRILLGGGPSLENRLPLEAGTNLTDDLLYEYALKECQPESPTPLLKPPGGGNGGGSSTQVIRVVNSRDPNEKQGPLGVGAERFIEGDRPLAYTVSFENVDTATAPAQEVRITDQLDPTKVELSTVELGPVTFGTTYVPVPPGLQTYTTDVDLRPATDLIVRVEGSVNGAGLMEWRFQSIDPATGNPTTDPDAGFLPPNDTPREGEGSVSFSVSPRANLADGTTLTNAASIIFDLNAPIVTNQWSNTIDRNPPTSGVSSVTRANRAGCPTNLAVGWSGTDAASGIGSYDVYVSENNQPFRAWQIDTTRTTGTFLGDPSKSYRFFSIARDRAGHDQNAPFGPVVPGSTGACATTAPPARPPTTPGVAAGRLRLVTKRVRLDKRRRIKLTARCTGATGARCRGTLRLTRIVRTGKGKRTRKRTLRVASVRYSIAAGKRAVLTLRIDRKSVRLINRAKRLALGASITPTGARATSAGRVTVRPVKKPRRRR